MNVKYGIAQSCFPGHGVCAVRCASQAGFEGLQIELGYESDGYYMAQKPIQEIYLEEAEKYSIAFPSLALCNLDFYGYVKGKNHPNYQIAIDSLDLAMKTCVDMGIDTLMVPHFDDNAIVDDFTMKNAVEVLKTTCKKAADLGLHIACEATLTIEDTVRLFESVDMPNMSLYYDSQNYNYYLYLSQKEVIESLYPYIKGHLHVKDGYGHIYDGGEMSNAMLGQGDSDFMGTISHLKKMNYEGWAVIENYYFSQNLRSLKPNCFDVMADDLRCLKAAMEA